MTTTENGVEARVLGRPCLAWQGRPLDRIGRKPLALAYMLAVRGDRGVSRDELAEVLWGPGRLGNLRSALYHLRRTAHASAWIDAAGADGRLRLRGRSDVADFERRLAAGDDEGALACWPREVLEAGPSRALLAGFAVPAAPTFDDWLDGERARVAALLRSCIVRHVDDEAALPADASALLSALSAEDPLDEELHRRIMTLAWRAGDRQRALQQYETCLRVLAGELGLEPASRTRELYDAIRNGPGRAPPADAQPVGRHDGDDLPFVGRERERATLRDRLRDRRWITLLGPGGTGKTRLARVASEEVRLHDDRAVLFVSLAAVRGGEFAVAAVANAARVAFDGPERPLVQLARGLRGRRLLLVLDNTEHLQPELGGVIEELLALAPGVQVLTTSRVGSRRPAEHLVRLGGLDHPAEAPAPGDRERDAVRLFVAAARRARPSFRLDDTVAADVLRVCATLRGHPLGIRLAAGWLRFRSCAELADAIAADVLLDNPGVAVEARHAGLRRVMETTWGLLEPEEAGTLARLAAFRGGFDAAAARDVAGAEPTALTSLAGAGWLDQPVPGRFALHPLVREFGFAQLRAQPEGTEVQARHARLYLRRLACRHDAIVGPEPRRALDAIEAEWADVRAAWSYGARSRWGGALADAADALSLYADMRVRFLEAERLFAEAGDALASRRPPGAADREADARARIRIGCGRGTHLYRLGRLDEALAATDEASRLVASSGPATDPALRHRPLRLRGDVLAALGRYDEALRVLQAALATSREALPDRLSRDLRGVANLQAALGRCDDAERNYRLAIACDRERGYQVGLAIDLNNLAELMIDQDRLDEAEGMIGESLAIAEDVDVHLVPYLELNLADLAAKRGDRCASLRHARRCAELAERYGQPALRSRASARRATVALDGGDVPRAGRLAGEAVRIAHEAGDRAATLHALLASGRVALAEGDASRAARLFAVVAADEASEARDAAVARRWRGLAPAPAGTPSLEGLVAELAGVA